MTPSTGSLPSEALAGTPAGRFSFQLLRDRTARRRAILFGGIGAAAYLVTLLATIPAALLVPRSEGVAAVGGTIWHGEAALAGGDRLSWRWAPLATLAHFAFAADFTVEGRDTALAGRALLRRSSVRLDDVSGAADARLLAALDPGLSFACAMPLQVNLTTLAVGGGDQRILGEVRSGGGSCGPKSAGAARVPVAPLILTAGDVCRATAGGIAPLGQRRLSLVTFTLSREGKLELAVTRAGAAALPFAAPPMGMAISTNL